MTLRRSATVVALGMVGAVWLLGVGPVALAKGPTEVRVEGPGLAAPLDIEVGMHGAGSPEYATLLNAAQVFDLGTSQLCEPASRPAGDLGPRFRLTWRFSSLGPYYAVDPALLRKPIRQDFYPRAPDGPVSRIAGRWVKALPGVSFWWKEISSDLVAARPGSGVANSLEVSGPGRSGFGVVTDLAWETSPHLRFMEESGLSRIALWEQFVACRDPAAPSGELGPRYTFTWTMGEEGGDWGVQDVYPFATGGPVIYDHASPANGAAHGGWFRADESLLAVWDKLGLPTQAQAKAATAIPKLAAAPATAPVAATTPAGSSSGLPWLLAVGGGLVVLTTGGAWLGVRWRRQEPGSTPRE